MQRAGEVLQAKVLEIMDQASAPLSAYAILGKLQDGKQKVAPVQVYRALSGLTERGRVRRIESLNAFVTCKADGSNQAAIFTICDDCGGVDEDTAPAVLSQISSSVKERGFSAARHVIEIHGVCADCQVEDGRG